MLNAPPGLVVRVADMLQRERPLNRSKHPPRAPAKSSECTWSDAHMQIQTDQHGIIHVIFQRPGAQ